MPSTVTGWSGPDPAAIDDEDPTIEMSPSAVFAAAAALEAAMCTTAVLAPPPKALADSTPTPVPVALPRAATPAPAPAVAPTPRPTPRQVPTVKRPPVVSPPTRQALPAAAAREAGVTDGAHPGFRERALAAHRRGASPAAALDVAPLSAWVTFGLLGAVILTVLVFSALGHVEVTARGRGALRASSGVVPIQAEIGGLVAEVRVRSGDTVHAGQLLVRLEAASIQASLLEAEKNLAFVTSKLAPAGERQQRLLLVRRRLLDRRAGLIKQRVSHQHATVGRLVRREREAAVLTAKGFLGRHQQDDADEELSEARRRLLTLEQELADTEAQESALAGQQESDDMTLGRELDQARARRDGAAMMLKQTAILAPQDGVVEAVLARAGELVTGGTLVGKLVPGGAPSRVVAFIEEKDRAFLQLGARARLEIDQLPVGEFGPLAAKVERVAGDLASVGEVHDALGDGVDLHGAYYRVELGLERDAQALKLAKLLRPGMLVNARFPLRDRRIVTLAFEPLKRWLQ